MYKEPAEVAGLALLHVQASCENGHDIVMPSFLNIEKEMPSSDETVSAYNVSRKDLVGKIKRTAYMPEAPSQ